MTQKWYKHPKRHPKNIDGPFYSLTDGDLNDKENCHSSCLDCDLPQGEARKLIKPLEGQDGDTYFIKQPETPEEVISAIHSTELCCFQAIRYGGDDPNIIKRMDSDLCDFYINEYGEVCLKQINE